ncbi:TasA family protein [Nocardioides caricicola]|uniref:TasA family protein n=1 Tax=Nocardioides caricicola TaxID=634770 RepID=A0ABW0NA41_9ACTN
MKLIATKSAAVKVLASAALVGGAASVAGLGTFGAFTSTTSASQDVATGKVVLSSTSTFGTPVTNMVPGDTIARTVTLTRSADTEAFGGVKLTTAGTSSNLLTSDTTNGLQLKVEECSVAWNNGACSGTTTTVVAQRGVVGATDIPASTLANLNAAGKTANLKVTLTLPATADNTFQGLQNTINFTFDATQRAAKAL